MHTRRRFVAFTNKPSRAGTLGERRIGAAAAIEAIASELSQCVAGRHDITWLSMHPASSSRGRIYYFSDSPGADADFAASMPQLPRLLASGKTDILLNFGPFTSTSVAARSLWATRAVPIVGMLHSLHPSSLVNSIIIQELSGHSLALDTFISPTYCGAQAYIRLRNEIASWLTTKLKTKDMFQGIVEVIPYGIPTQHFSKNQQQQSRKTLGLSHDPVIFLCVGRYARQEKADLLPLLWAMRLLKEKGANAQLALVGAKNEETDKLTEAITDAGLHGAVKIYENVSAQDKLSFYDACDVFISLSDGIQETYGLTILEAMAAGKPVIATGWNGYRELVQHEKTGFLVPTYDTSISDTLQAVQILVEGTTGYGHRDLHESVSMDLHALHSYMQRMIDCPELRMSMGQAGRKLCVQDHDGAKQAQKILQLLEEICDEAQRCPWARDAAAQPFVDRVVERFSHYPSHGRLLETSDVALEGDNDAHWRHLVLRAINVDDSYEIGIIDEMCRFASAEGKGCSVSAMIGHFTSQGYMSSYVLPRIARCLKYGFLRRIQGST